MGRRPRIHFSGALYHVISRGNQRQSIFKDASDYARFQLILREAQERYSFKLYAYVLMPNHVHLLVEVKHHPLSKVMQSLLYRFTRYYNKRHRKIGHLFQGRYRAILCEKESYLLELIRYLHLNPVRAKLVRDPKQYRWSSHGNYLTGEDGGGIALEEVLSSWSKRRAEAVRRYRDFVLEGLGEGHRQDYYEVKEQRYLGDQEFIERVEREEEVAEAPTAVKITVAEVMEGVCRQWKKEPGDIIGKGRGREGSRLRAVAAYVGREVGGLRLKEMGRYLGRDIATLSLSLRRLEERMREQGDLKRKVEQLCTELRKGRRRQYQITKA